MPQIKDYTPSQEAGGPVTGRRATAEDFGGGVADSLSQFGGAAKGAGEALYKAQERSEVSDLTVKMSKAHSDYTMRLQEAVRAGGTPSEDGTVSGEGTEANPNPDHGTLSESFLKSFDDHMNDVGANVTTAGARRYFEQAKAQYRGQFAVEAAQGQAEIAGIKAKQDANTRFNVDSSLILNNPSQFDFKLQEANRAIDAQHEAGSMDFKTATQMKEITAKEYAKISVEGWIKLSPDHGIAMLNEGKMDKYFDGEVKKELYAKADQQKRANVLEDERLKKAQEEALKLRQEASQKGLLSDIYAGKASVDDILHGSGKPMTPAQQENMLSVLKAVNKEKVQGDPAVELSVYKRINLPDGDPNKINNIDSIIELAPKGLGVEGAQKMIKEFEDRRTPEGRKESDVKGELFKTSFAKLAKPNGFGIPDPDGVEQNYKATAEMSKAWEEGRKAGKSVDQLSNPDSPDYVGKLIGKYVRTNQEKIQAIKTNLRAGANADLSGAAQQINSAVDQGAAPKPAPVVNEKAWRPGESVEQWRARTKAGQ